MYLQCSKNGKAFWMNNWPLKPDLVLPQSEVKRLMREPEDVLSVSANLDQNFATFYTMPFVAHPTHENVIRRYLTRRLPELTASTADEVEAALRDEWGTDTEAFREVRVLETAEHILARADNRVFVGLPLCRDAGYLSNAVGFARDVAVAGKIINVVPAWMKPVVGRLVTIPNRLHYRRASQWLMPHIKERLEQYHRSSSSGEKEGGEAAEKHNDFITWIIEDAIKHGDPRGLDPEVISFRIIDVNFAAIHTSSFTSTNALLDIASSPPSPSADGTTATTPLDSLREEVLRVYHDEEGGRWTKAGLERLVRVDSAIRESMRHTGIFYRGAMRKVVRPGGYQATPDVLLPPGYNVGTSAYSVHHDEDFYDDPHRYDAFRFSRPREEAAAAAAAAAAATEGGGEGNEASAAQRLEAAVAADKASSLNTTGEAFLGWGHGKRACPGRYFAADVMRLMLASMVKDYEIEPLGRRPPSKWMLDTVMPPAGATLRVRRRKEA